MIEDLSDIRDRIQAGRFNNEATVRQGIVERLLSLLSWPVWDTEIVSPEYSLEGRRVDYALCPPPGRPAAFIEVKQPGQGDGADRQLFEYAFHRGVPMAILTDGREWHFFLPAEQGDYGERRVYKLDILERDLDESARRLERYLGYQRVRSGEAIEAARKDYRDVTKDREIRRTLPHAWAKLIEDQDEILVDLIAEKVESLCGYKPDPDVVAAFLTSRLRLTDLHTISQPGTILPSRSPRPAPKPAVEVQGGASPYGFVLDGRNYVAANARDVLVKVIHELASRDVSFLERFSSLETRAGMELPPFGGHSIIGHAMPMRRCSHAPHQAGLSA